MRLHGRHLPLALSYLPPASNDGPDLNVVRALTCQGLLRAQGALLHWSGRNAAAYRVEHPVRLCHAAGKQRWRERVFAHPPSSSPQLHSFLPQAPGYFSGAAQISINADTPFARPFYYYDDPQVMGFSTPDRESLLPLVDERIPPSEFRLASGVVPL